MVWEVHAEKILFPCDGQDSALGLEPDGIAVDGADVEQHEGGAERGMAAEIDLDLGREPAQAVDAILRDDEGCLRQVVFRRYCLHGRFR